MINIWFVTVPLEKGKETLVRGWGGSEGQKIISAGLPLPTFFRKNVLIWGLCDYCVSTISFYLSQIKDVLTSFISIKPLDDYFTQYIVCDSYIIR